MNKKFLAAGMAAAMAATMLPSMAFADEHSNFTRSRVQCRKELKE